MDRPPKPQQAASAPPLPDLTKGRSVPKTRAQPVSQRPVAPPPPGDLAPRDLAPRDLAPRDLAPPFAATQLAPPRKGEVTEELSLVDAQALPSEQIALDAFEAQPTHAGRSQLQSLPPIGQFGRYELLGRLAYGGMAEIFLARELGDAGARSGRFVVVKRVLPHVAEDHHFVEMFVDEARLAMHLQHPNICHVYAFGEEQNAFFLAMEWINGMPLSKVVRRARERGGVPIAHALKIVAQVAEALDHAHRACDQNGEPLGIVHRDVSPQNLMVAYDGHVKLLDFGIAKAASHSTRTEAGVVKGKFAYMSPQQCLGEPIDSRADVFALGLCLYEILAGRNPYKRQTEFDTMRALVYEDAPPIAEALGGREQRPDIVAAIESLLARAIAKRPEDRFQTAADMQVAIEQLLGRMGEVVTAARLGELMHDLFAAEIKVGPQLDTRMSVPPQRPSSASGDLVAPVLIPPPGTTQKVEMALDDGRPSSVLPARRSAFGLIAALAGLFLFAVLGGVGAWIAYTVGTLQAQPDIVTIPPSPTPSRASNPAPRIAAVATPPTTGSIYIDSTPGGASVELGDRGAVGTTPLDLAMLETGVWYVRLQAEGYEEWERSIEIRAGERAHVVATLSPVRPEPRDEERPRIASTTPPRDRTATARPSGPPGHLSINSRPWSKVYVGSRLLGTTPIGDIDVPSGTLRLRFVDRDGVEHTRTITVPEGGHAREFFDLREQAETPTPE